MVPSLTLRRIAQAQHAQLPTRVITTSGVAPSPFGGRATLALYRLNTTEPLLGVVVVDINTRDEVQGDVADPSKVLRVETTFADGVKSKLAPDFYIPTPPCGIPNMQRLWDVAVSRVTHNAQKARKG